MVRQTQTVENQADTAPIEAQSFFVRTADAYGIFVVRVCERFFGQETRLEQLGDGLIKAALAGSAVVQATPAAATEGTTPLAEVHVLYDEFPVFETDRLSVS